ncbi:hypothetical protein SAMN05216522_10971 [Rosenbergiella nectarea]|uniref:Uncharacterized protein n=1 Tax=Rosenbergiella nectarea TaxID=988801 RepID=A0A1H9KDB2_9GAMM|nr:hypothetical protein SAMN05216522_10971 [Rosenbergiella nectarea]
MPVRIMTVLFTFTPMIYKFSLTGVQKCYMKKSEQRGPLA